MKKIFDQNTLNGFPILPSNILFFSQILLGYLIKLDSKLDILYKNLIRLKTKLKLTQKNIQSN